MLVAGTDDPVSPFAGGETIGLDGKRLGRVLSAEATMDRILRSRATGFDTSGFSSLPPVIQGRVELREWRSGPGLIARLYVVHGGGHTIPGSSDFFPVSVGAVSRDIEFADAVLHFMGAWNPSNDVDNSAGAVRGPAP